MLSVCVCVRAGMTLRWEFIDVWPLLLLCSALLQCTSTTISLMLPQTPCIYRHGETERERESAPGPWLCCHGDPVASNSHHGNVQDVPHFCSPGLGLYDPSDHHLLGRCRCLPFLFAHSCLPGPQSPAPRSPEEATDLSSPVLPVGHRCLC